MSAISLKTMLTIIKVDVFTGSASERLHRHHHPADSDVSGCSLWPTKTQHWSLGVTMQPWCQSSPVLKVMEWTVLCTNTPSNSQKDCFNFLCICKT